MKCSECGRTETARWYGKTTDTPICCSCYRKSYVAKNREKALAAQRKANASDKSRQARKEYGASDRGKEAKNRYDRGRYWKDPESAKARKKKCQNPDYNKNYYIKNKATYHERSVRRSKNLNAASLNGLHRDKTIEIYDNCPEGYEVDHIVPIKGKDFRDGEREHVVCGLHVFWNLQYLPKLENRKKGCNLYSCNILSSEES